jgi:hypothetical protein
MPKATKPDPHELIAWRGVTIDRCTAAAIVVCEQELGYELTLIKAHDAGAPGSVSSTTHNGLGVVDFAPYDWQNKLRALKKFMAANHRVPAQGPWSEHIHACSFCTIGMDPLAVAQIRDYNHKPPLDGLAGHRPDPDPWRHPAQQVFDFDAYWTDTLLQQRITTIRGRLKKVADRISALRARRRNLRAQLKAAKSGLTYLH